MAILDSKLCQKPPADLQVIEAVVENLKVKQKLFVDLEQRVSQRCLLVTNTSSFLLDDVACKMSRLRANFGGLHFFNPVSQSRVERNPKLNKSPPPP